MARGYLKEKEYHMTDLQEYIRRLMRISGYSGTDLARKMGHTQTWFSKKLTSGNWKAEELMDLFKILKAESEMVGRILVI